MCYNNPEMPREAGAVNFLEMSDAVMRKKISILGAGNVGATIAYTLAVDGMASEIVIVDINKDKARRGPGYPSGHAAVSAGGYSRWGISMRSRIRIS